MGHLAARGLLVSALALAACATPQTDRLLGERVLPLPLSRALDVPFHPQSRGHCGPAALATALAASGDPATPAELADWVYTPGSGGSYQHDLLTAVARRGRLAYPVGDLEALLADVAAGQPVVVLQNQAFGWWPVWHYAVAVGYDLERVSIALHTGTHAAREMSLRTFERTWARSERWGFVVLAPGVLPGAAREERYLEAVESLERVERWAEAEAAYAAATRRWGTSARAWLGLGNARYARGDLAGAEAAFRAAAAAGPDAGPALNNLAHVLLEAGRRDEALAAIERALELGGPLVPTYRRTLGEIERAASE